MKDYSLKLLWRRINLKKLFVAYDSKYGNTKKAAENILKGIEKVTGIEASIGYVKKVDVGSLVDFDLIILGAPNHMARPSRTIKKFVNKLADLDLKTENVAIFGTYAGKYRAIDRAVKKLQKFVEKKLSSLTPVSPPLSVRVSGIRGPVREGELPRCIDFGEKLAKQLVNQ